MNNFSKMKVNCWIYNHYLSVLYLANVSFGYGWMSDTKFQKFSGKEWIWIFKIFSGMDQELKNQYPLTSGSYYCCDWKSPSGMCAKLCTVVASNKEIMRPNHAIIGCSRHIYIVVLRAHPVHGESHIQRNTTGEVATTSPPFYNEPHWSHVLCMKAELGMTFAS